MAKSKLKSWPAFNFFAIRSATSLDWLSAEEELEDPADTAEAVELPDAPELFEPTELVTELVELELET